MRNGAGFQKAQAPAVELMQIADDGLPLRALAEAAEALGLAEPVLGTRLMGKATYCRLKKRKDARLNAVQSATVLRQMRLRAFANRVFKDESRAQMFMAKPHAMLGGKAPFEAAFSEFGGEAASYLLGRAQYGSAAVLRVPSSVVRLEWNFVFLPGHKDFARLRATEPLPLWWDKRLFSA